MDRKAFIEKIDQVAELMRHSVAYNEDSTSSPERHRALLTHADLDICINAGEYRKADRLAIHGCFPRSEDGYYYGPRNGNHSITVSDTKTPTQIVKDIERRLMPDYLIAIEKAVQDVKDRNADIIQAADSLHSVADALGEEPRFQNNMESSGDGSVYAHDFHGLEARYRYGGVFEVKLGLDLQELLNLIAFLKISGPVSEVSISSADIKTYGLTHVLSDELVEHLIDNMDNIVDQVVKSTTDGWASHFEAACDAYVNQYPDTNEAKAQDERGTAVASATIGNPEGYQSGELF